MSKIEVNAIEPQCGTTLTLGASGDTVTLASGASQSGFGRSGSVNWQTGSIKTSGFTAANGEGYFCNTSGGAFTATLPASPSAGDIVAFSDYTRTFGTNKLTIGRNSQPIGGIAQNAELTVNGQSATFVYVDGTEGWINVQETQTSQTGIPPFIAATGGTITTSGDFKIHTFTGPGTFTVTCGGSPSGSTTVDYMVIGGGGGAGAPQCDNGGGGGGAGGFRQSFPNPSTGGFPISAQAYPIVVGSGGAGGTSGSPSTSANQGTNGVNSSFSSITSAGGGGAGGGGPNAVSSHDGKDGGSGGGGGGGNADSDNFGAGNTPPVSPPQGNPGGVGGSSVPGTGDQRSGGGGGAGGAGAAPSGSNSGNGGAGVASAISGSCVTRAGGGAGFFKPSMPARATATGGGGQSPGFNGTDNTGGGGGAKDAPTSGVVSGNGGSGIVIIRYKFQ